MSQKEWGELKVTRDEVNKISEALKKEEFRKMLVDYCEEISDPENRKLYEREIIQLEKERGVDVTFINPEPGYVIKTSADGKSKAFINIATNDKIDKPSSASMVNTNGERGLNWSLPYTLTPPRQDMDKKNQLCYVYDVVFHPDALHLASRNTSFRKLVNDTAIDAIQQAHNVQLDRANLKFPKLSYKGIARATVIRKKIADFDGSEIEPSPIDSIYPPMPDESKETPREMKLSEAPINEYTIPKYKIVQRRSVDYQEMTHEIDAKLNVTIPNELVVSIDLPLLNNTQDAQLDVTKKRIVLLSEKPAKYRLDINLPYEVIEENGSAKFDKTKRQLVITLPVVSEKKLRITDFQREDSGIESDHQQQQIDGKESESSNDSPTDDNSNDSSSDNAFLDTNTDYMLPNFTFNQIDEILAFTLHVKNVDPSSISIDRKDLINIAHIKFSSIGSGFFPIHYSFCVRFPSQYSGIFREISAEAWDNNVIFQFELNNYDFPSYEAGKDINDMVSYDIAEKLMTKHPMTSDGKEIEDDSLSIEVNSDHETEVIIEVTRKDSETSRNETSNDEVSEDVFGEEDVFGDNFKRQSKKATRKRNKRKMRSMSESYCDQLKVINEMDSLKLDEKESKGRKKARSVSESSDEHGGGDAPQPNHHLYKSILKNRSSFSECNESPIDDRRQSKNFYSMSADFGICQSHDSLSESCKKTVRFSDIIKRQIFRSNTSILAQKKKNQKKKASRKRALDRRHSEGSESEKHDDEFDEKEDDDVRRFEHVSNDMKSEKRDSGVDLSEKNATKIKISNKKSNANRVMNGNDVNFKSGMIFDLEM
ncbi:CLUMA_CG016371, isoform A [Clunio marinus]|uniref:Protein kintoun n=1 Tax=Clunio marinus TaxID=568069 RepID=A0A1J1IUC5_9DIPT|nr:CLUMA_CG016371, isoform A [Clunio marinus]